MGLKESGLRASVRSVSTVVPAFFDVAITDTNSPVNEGDVLVVDYSVDNTGDSFETQDIRLEIESVQEDADLDVSLSGGASDSGTLEWDTTNEDETTYTATVLSDDNTDSVTVEIEAAIRDSEADQKLFRRWVLDDVNGSVSELVEGDDGTNNGVTSVSGDWVGGSAGEGDGVDDHILTSTLGDFGSNLDTGWAVALSIEMTDSGAMVTGSRGGPSDQRWEITIDRFTDDELDILIDDQDGLRRRVNSTDLNISTGEKYRLVLNHPAGNDAENIEMWSNQTELSTNIQNNGNGTNFGDFAYDIPLFGLDDGGSIIEQLPAILDDVCFYEDSLTQSEIESYTNPWS